VLQGLLDATTRDMALRTNDMEHFSQTGVLVLRQPIVQARVSEAKRYTFAELERHQLRGQGKFLTAKRRTLPTPRA